MVATKPGSAHVGNLPPRNGGGQNTWTVVIMAGALILTLVGQFWALANPRDDIKQVRLDFQTYLKDADYHLQDEIKTLRTDLAKEIDKNENELSETRKLLRDTAADILKAAVTVREYEEFKSREVIRQTEDEHQLHEIESRMITTTQHQDLVSRVDALQAHYVPREEHVEHWNQFTERLNGLAGSINELRHDFSGSFTVTDAVKQLQREIEELRSQHPANTATVPTIPLAPSTSK